MLEVPTGPATIRPLRDAGYTVGLLAAAILSGYGLLAPERLALALIKDGWVLRSKVIWSKPNSMPASVRDRLACTWEVIYLFVRGPRYHFDLDRWQPYIGANIGYQYGDNVNDSWLAGPEAGVKYFVNATTFIDANVAYEFNLEEGLDDGAFFYGLGIGFKW